MSWFDLQHNCDSHIPLGLTPWRSAPSSVPRFPLYHFRTEQVSLLTKPSISSHLERPKPSITHTKRSIVRSVLLPGIAHTTTMMTPNAFKALYASAPIGSLYPNIRGNVNDDR